MKKVLLLSIVLVTAMLNLSWGQVSISISSFPWSQAISAAVANSTTLPTGFTIDSKNTSTSNTTSAVASFLRAGSVTSTETGDSHVFYYSSDATQSGMGFIFSGTGTKGWHPSSAAINFNFKNTTGSTITALGVSVDYRNWRPGLNSEVFTVTGSTGSAQTTLNYTYSPDASVTGSTVPGTLASTNVGYLTGLSIANNATYTLTWTSTGNAANAHGCGIANIQLGTDFYSKSSGDLLTSTNWFSNTGGSTGFNPSDFSAAGITFHLANNTPGVFTGATSSSNTIACNLVGAPVSGPVTFKGGTNGGASTNATFTLSGTNTYTGGTTIGTGSDFPILSVASSGSIPSGNITVKNGGQLSVTATGQTISNNITINGQGNANGNAGAIRAGVAALTFSGGVTLGSDAFIYSTGSNTNNITISGVIGDGGGNFGLTKQGGGNLILSNSNTYGGATTISNGILKLSTGNDRINTTTTVSLGQASSSNVGTFDLAGFNQQVAGITSITGASPASKNTITTSTGSSTLTIGGSGTYSYGDGSANNSGLITGAVGVTMNGSGTQTLGDANTYTGLTKITQGTLNISPTAAAGTITLSGGVQLDGGTLGTSGIGAVTANLGALSLTNSSIIALSNTNNHLLKFSASPTFTATKTITITGWVGTAGAGTAGTKGQVFIGTSNGLTAGQLAQITFTNVNGVAGSSYTATQRSNGEVIPNQSTVYYYQSGDVSSAANWNSASAGGGTTLSAAQNNFTTAGITYNFNNAGSLSNDLTISGTGSKLVIGAKLNINGHNLTIQDVSGGSAANSFTGSASSTLTINGTVTGSVFMDATSTATATLKSLTVSSGGTATLGNAMNIDPSGVVTVNSSSTLATGGFLTLKSTTTSTAYIASLSAGTVSGNVNIEFHLNAQRGYRLMGNPFNSAITFSTLGGFFDIYANSTKYGQCTSQGNTVYTAGAAANTSVPNFSNATVSSIGTASSTTTGDAYLMFIRGGLNQGCLNQYYQPTAVSYTLTGGVNSGSLTQTIPANKWAIITNPLPAPITIPSVAGSGATFYVVEPGGQPTHPGHNDSKFTAVAAGAVIPIGGAFMASNSNGTPLNFIIGEGSKAGSNSWNNVPFKTTNQYPVMNIDVMHKNANWDNWTLVNKPLTSPSSADADDLQKLSNANLDIYSLSADNKHMFIDNRDADSIADGTVIGLGLRSIILDTFSFQVSDYTLPANKTVYLHDKYANTYALVTNGFSYSFVVNTDAASSGDNRFELLFNNVVSTTGVNNVSGQHSVRIMPNPATNNITLLYNNTFAGNKQISIINALGQVVKQVNSEEQIVNIQVSDLANGVYLVRTATANNTVTERFIKN